MQRYKRVISHAAMRGVLGAAALAASHSVWAQDQGPIKIGVIAEAQAVAGSSIPSAAQIAADEINAKGGVDGRKIEIVSYDNHSSSTESVRAFQRAVNEDHVNAVIASYISEVVLALEPWAARLKTVMITPGAASDVITANIAKDYEHNKYTFHGYLTSGALSHLVCDAGKDMLVDGLKMKTAVIMSEDAAWTTPLDAGYLECLPKIGLKVLDHIRFSPDTTDFTPIFNKIEGEKPDVIITGISTSARSRRCSGRANRCRSRCSALPRRRRIRPSGRTPMERPTACCIKAYRDRRRRDPQNAAVCRGVPEEVRKRAVVRRVHRLRRRLYHRRRDPSRGIDRQRQARRRDGEDRLRRDDRPSRVSPRG